MTLAEYLETRPRKRGELRRLAQESGLDYSTVWRIARRGDRLDSYSKAKRLSAATGGAVSIADLCDVDLCRATGT